MTDLEKRYFAVMAIGKDDQGIVAAITSVLTRDHECNIETSHMMILGGQFSMMLIASSTSDTTAPQLEESLAAAARDTRKPGREPGNVGRDRRESLRWRVYVDQIDPEGFHPFSPDPSHSITVACPDRHGIVHDVARILAHNRVNITTLSSGRSEEDKSRCVVALDVALPPKVTELLLEEALKQIDDLELVDIEALRRHPSADRG